MQFPYGIAQFDLLRTEHYFYVDRTDRIASLEATGRQLLLLRPRRFGKSLWLSTLDNSMLWTGPSDLRRCLAISPSAARPPTSAGSVALFFDGCS